MQMFLPYPDFFMSAQCLDYHLRAPRAEDFTHLSTELRRRYATDCF